MRPRRVAATPTEQHRGQNIHGLGAMWQGCETVYRPCSRGDGGGGGATYHRVEVAGLGVVAPTVLANRRRRDGRKRDKVVRRRVAAPVVGERAEP
eukprot:2590631-Prymnesium_polylepis.1